MSVARYDLESVWTREGWQLQVTTWQANSTSSSEMKKQLRQTEGRVVIALQKSVTPDFGCSFESVKGSSNNEGAECFSTSSSKQKKLLKT